MIRARMSELDLADLGDDIWDELSPRATVALVKGATVIVEAWKRNLSRPGSASTASPAGEPPEMDRGKFRDSIQLFKVSRTKYGIRQGYGSTHPAAGLHEFGGSVSKDGVKRIYPPRPSARPAEASTEAEVEGILDAI